MALVAQSRDAAGMKCASWLALPIGLGLTTCAPPLPPSIEFTVLQANVGNAKLSCGDDYIYKLCDVDVEQRIAAQIAQLAPDVVVLQEVVPDALCDGFVEGDATKVCDPVHRAGEPSQVRRLLGDGYDIACDERNGYECIGVRSAGRVRPAGAYRTAPVVEVDGVVCDPGFSVGSRPIVVRDSTVVVVVGHPHSTQPACRAAQVRQIFTAADDADVGLVGGETQPAIVAGDMNLDPFNFGLNAVDESVDVWSAHVYEVDDADPGDFVYASGPTERRPPWPTSTTLLDQVLDHVVVRGLEGSCVTLGEAEGTTRLDGGEGCDHRALSCRVSL